MKAILLLGCPGKFTYILDRFIGSGKGTQARRILNRFHVSHICAGDILRSSKNPTVQHAIRTGHLVHDHFVNEYLWGYIEKAKNVILDGFPRNLEQAHWLDERLALDIVINLDVPEEVITKRLVDRWIHEPSGRIYNTHFNPPKKPGLDDLTGEALKKRPDDDVSIIKTRIEEYHLLTEPLIDYYKSKNKLYNFKGSSSDEITPSVLSLLEKRFPELNKN